MTEENKNKLSSRKFIVWLTWLILSAIVIVLDITVLTITKAFPESLIEFSKLMMKYFFTISGLYLGLNVGQKVAFAYKDTKVQPKEEEENVQ